jgi:hypothetical protein
MFNYIFQIVPNSLNYDTNPGNVQKEYKIYKKCSITFFKLYQIHQIMILIPEMYKKNTKCNEMFYYIFQIVPNSLNYDTNPGNVQK